MKLTRKQRGKLKTLVHNIIQSEEWEFTLWDLLKEQKKALEVDFDIPYLSAALKIEILDEKQSRESYTRLLIRK